VAGTLTLTCAGSGRGSFLVDGGRPFYRARGIARGGAADTKAASVANRLLSQSPDRCCMELTLTGGCWLLSGYGQIALTGADMNWRLNGAITERYGVTYLNGDYLLTGATAMTGCRAYLAIKGDWQLPRVLGSVEGGVPGTLEIVKGSSIQVVSHSDAPYRSALLPSAVPQPLRLKASPGPEWLGLSYDAQIWLRKQVFTVSSNSSRQGIRLNADAIPKNMPAGILSSPVLPGTVQLTPDGPILLGPDAQTVGGYARVLLLEDYAPAFQLRPGDRLRFDLGESR
jgi:antagonist of KipI